MITNSDALRCLAIKNRDAIISAAKRADRKKTDIMLDVNSENAISLRTLCKKHRVSENTMLKSFKRWGVCENEIRSKLSTTNTATDKIIFSFHAMIINSLGREDPLSFSEICRQIKSSPGRVKRVFLERGVDLNDMIALPGGSAKDKYSKKIYNWQGGFVTLRK
jgi:hypothetical protein